MSYCISVNRYSTFLHIAPLMLTTCDRIMKNALLVHIREPVSHDMLQLKRVKLRTSIFYVSIQ